MPSLCRNEENRDDDVYRRFGIRCCCRPESTGYGLQPVQRGLDRRPNRQAARKHRQRRAKKTATGRTNLFQLSAMAYNAKKTEHAGAKKGRGAFYGRKVDAKKASNRRRRQNDKRATLTNGASQA